MNILFLASRPKGLDFLPDTAEKAALYESVRSVKNVKIDHLSQVTYDSLLSQFDKKDYHILHFDGHGVFAKQCPKCQELSGPAAKDCQNIACKYKLIEIQPKGFLAFESTSHLIDWVDTDSLAQLFSRSTLRLAFLSACQTNIVRGKSFFGGLGPGLIRFGIPAAIGMQFSIPVQSAIRFVKGFYSELVKSGRISASVAHGRKHLYREQQWFVPVAYVRDVHADDSLFDT